MDAASSDTDLLRRHFSGKRSSPRVTVTTPVALVGSEGPVLARALDLSEGGAQVEILEPEFVSSASDGAAACAFLVQRHFEAGLVWTMLDLSGHPIVEIESDLVRINVGPDAKDGVRAGIRFRRPLTPEERDALGLEASVEDAPRWVHRRGPPAFLLIFPTSGATVGPLCAARVQWIRGRSVGALVEAPADPNALARLLGEGSLHASLLAGGRRVWDCGGRAARATAVDRAVEIEWNGEDAVDPEALRGFRRA
jgi:hypothetical protein